jgi:ABC-type nitrate/sulfonate/bicarbonate transport system permease component
MSDVSFDPKQSAPATSEPPGGPSPRPDAQPSSRANLWRVLGGVGWVASRVYPLALILGVWQLIVTLELVSPFTMPAPARVWDRAVLAWEAGSLQRDTWTTLSRVLISYGLALAVGVALGLLIGRVEKVRLVLRPVVSFFFPTPKVAIYPAMVILFGLGSASKIALGFSEAVFPIILATSAAASQIEPRLMWSAQAFGTSRRAMFPRVVLPAALPGIMTGGRIALVGAIIGVFMGELIVGADGLGHTMAVAYRSLQTGDMYVAVVLMSGIGFVLDRLFLVLRSRMLVWSPEGDE